MCGELEPERLQRAITLTNVRLSEKLYWCDAVVAAVVVVYGSEVISGK